MFSPVSGSLAGGVLSALSRPSAARALAKHLGRCITTSSAAADSHFEPVTVDPLTDDVATFVNEVGQLTSMEMLARCNCHACHRMDVLEAEACIQYAMGVLYAPDGSLHMSI